MFSPRNILFLSLSRAVLLPSGRILARFYGDIVGDMAAVQDTHFGAFAEKAPVRPLAVPAAVLPFLRPAGAPPPPPPPSRRPQLTRQSRKQTLPLLFFLGISFSLRFFLVFISFFSV